MEEFLNAVEEVADYDISKTESKSIRIIKLTNVLKCHIEIDMLVYQLKSTDETLMDVKYATGLTTIKDANRGT